MKTGKFSNMGKINKSLLYNQWTKEEIKEKFKNMFKTKMEK